MINFFNELNQMLWGNGLISILLGMGIFCLIYPKGKCLHSFQLLVNGKFSGKRTLFRTCMTCLGAAMGTGNIVGVAAALSIGGAGAIFWMWVSGFCGMGLIYAENVLSCRYRKNHLSGAAAYLSYGLNSPKLAKIFSFCCVVASFGMGNMSQSHAIAESLHSAYRIPEWGTGIILIILLWGICSGGAERMKIFSSWAVPILTGIYFLCAGVIIFRYRENLPEVFTSIFRGAFGIQAIGGGISGTALKQAISAGIRRGIFSNEAGLGSSGLLHGEAETEQPEILGLCGMLEVIADTFLCCTATALVILCTNALNTKETGAVLVLNAFRQGMGKIADWIFPPITALFAFCTLVGWCYCGMTAWKIITQGKKLNFYQKLFCLAAGIGTMAKAEFIWTIADIANACMAYCNLPAILLLFPNQNRCTVYTAQRFTEESGENQLL